MRFPLLAALGISAMALSASATGQAAAKPAGPVPAEPLTLERLFANPPLLGTAPRALAIAPDGRHTAWLQPRAEDALRYDLWVEEIATGARAMAVDSLALSAAPAGVSEAELMRRERVRLASVKGIVEFQWTPDGAGLLVPLDGDIWLAPLAGPARRLTNTPATEIDAKLSPRGAYASFVRDQNLVALELATGTEIALTLEGGGPVSFGVAEFVAQEEMERRTGQWWAPDESRIAIARVDESAVRVAVRAAIGSDGTRISEQRYPFAGTPNAQVALQIHDLAGSPPVLVDLGPDPDIYVARVNWLNPRELVVERQTRDQKRLDLLLIDAGTGASRLLFSETSNTWVNLSHSLRPLADGKSFLWTSERSGFRHIYLWDGSALKPITSGDWPVSELVVLDEPTGQILFSGFSETPLEKALYRVALAGGPVQRLTPPGGWTETVSDARGTAMLLTRSTPTTPPEVELATSEGGPLTIRRRISGDDFPYARNLAAHIAPTYGTLKAADGRTDLHYALSLPPKRPMGGRVPLFFEVYAGPGIQRVTRQFQPLLHQYLLQKGWAVLRVDNRGTPNRGRAFEAALHLKVGQVDMADQMAALDWARTQPWADPDRVAVHGWSYGGYMVTRMMTEHPKAFAAGVAVASVTDWTLYDTHYTERYLGNPANDKAPYTASDVTLRAARLERPLLLVHGLADDNVVFDHTAKLMGSLQKAVRPFETMLYPGQTHAIGDPAIQLHLWQTIMAFLDRHVRKATR